MKKQGTDIKLSRYLTFRVWGGVGGEGNKDLQALKK